MSVRLSVSIQDKFPAADFGLSRPHTHMFLRMLREGILLLRPALPTLSSSRASYKRECEKKGWKGGRGGEGEGGEEEEVRVSGGNELRYT